MAAPDLGAAYAAALRHVLPPKARRLGLAVSGGSDSSALLYLTASWAADHGVDLTVATVDHGLRPESGAEAQHVAQTAATLGLPHVRLALDTPLGRSNLQAEARAARYAALARWASGADLDAVLLGHTQDDVAETLLIGLGRGAGLDGLSSMRASFVRDDILFLRPLLDFKRDDLRRSLRARNAVWIEDPSNDDTRFQRVRVRQALTTLAEAGLNTDSIATAARALRRTRESLDEIVASFTRTHVQFDRGDVLIEGIAFKEAPSEIARRVLAQSLRTIASRDYAPRAQKLLPLVDAPIPQGGVTLHGCLIRAKGNVLRLSREPEAARRAPSATPDTLWDGRWRVTGPETDVEIRALGADGLAACPDWRQAGLPRASLLASPGIWRDDLLIAAPLVGFAPQWRANCRIPFTATGFWR